MHEDVRSTADVNRLALFVFPILQPAVQAEALVRILPADAPSLVGVAIAEPIRSHDVEASETGEVVRQEKIRLLVVRGKLVGSHEVVAFFCVVEDLAMVAFWDDVAEVRVGAS